MSRRLARFRQALEKSFGAGGISRKLACAAAMLNRSHNPAFVQSGGIAGWHFRSAV
ncbi:hypothetical protein [Mesorhizobium sp. INR15]|uniref:hypothetical protein n=1 Tax=Mesorhizobium sp. INR15 TaxID=2654248 RepID=UPI001896676F|nr:hypothetical protein [Mesorhizobium sp. INR15]